MARSVFAATFKPTNRRTREFRASALLIGRDGEYILLGVYQRFEIQPRVDWLNADAFF